MYCNRCGAYIPEDADFCPQCGSRVSRRAAQAQMQEGIPIRRAHRSNSIIFGAILAVAAVLIVCIICLTIVTKGNQQAQLEASKQSKTQQEEQPKHSTDSANSDAEDTTKQEESSSDSEVTNNYYYYGSDTEHANDYYNQVGSNGYLWPSDSEYISASDLSGFNQDTVAAIRNEIYARHGYAFHSTRWQNYFSSKTWYHRDSTCTANTIDSRLSDVERANIATLVSYEESKGWR